MNIDFCFPGKKFPAFSITGNHCSLDCLHCGGRYLRGMKTVLGPEELINKSRILYKRGGTGLLVSGGCDKNGKVPLERYLEALKIIKQMGLKVNVHTGLAGKEDLEKLKNKADAISLDFVSEPEVVERIYGVKDFDPDAYLNIIKSVKSLKIVPHLCIGLDHGRIYWEKEAIRLLSGAGINTITLLVLIPTRGTRMEKISPPEIEETIDILSFAKEKIRDVSLGCMRPFQEYRARLDGLVLEENLVNRIVNPHPSARKKASELGYDIRTRNACCAV
jgi:uncharacterized radical SAM superfamily protein